MRVADKAALLPPGVCILCRAAATEGTEMVDTDKSFVTGFPTGVEGRVYVCESCVRGLGEAIGLEAGDRVAKAEESERLARAELNALRDHIISTAKSLETGSMDLAQGEAPAVVAAASAESDAAAAVVEEKAADKPAADESA